MKDFLNRLAQPRVLTLLAGIIVQILEQFGIQVDNAIVENVIDLITLLAFGRVAQKSEEGKLI